MKFGTRRIAEAAFQKGRVFSDHPLALSWHQEKDDAPAADAHENDSIDAPDDDADDANNALDALNDDDDSAVVFGE